MQSHVGQFQYGPRVGRQHLHDEILWRCQLIGLDTALQQHSFTEFLNGSTMARVTYRDRSRPQAWSVNCCIQHPPSSLRCRILAASSRGYADPPWRTRGTCHGLSQDQVVGTNRGRQRHPASSVHRLDVRVQLRVISMLLPSGTILKHSKRADLCIMAAELLMISQSPSE